MRSDNDFRPTFWQGVSVALIGAILFVAGFVLAVVVLDDVATNRAAKKVEAVGRICREVCGDE